MKRMIGYKRIGLVVVMAAAMILTAGCDLASATYSLDQQGQNTDQNQQEVETPEANETEQANNSDDGAQGDEGEVSGTIDSINGNTIVIDGQTYTVPDDLAADLAALTPGSTVKIEFFVDANGNLVITQIEVEDDQGENEDVNNEDDQGENEQDEIEATETPEPAETEEAGDNSGSGGESGDDGGDDGGSGGSGDGL